MCFPSPRIHPSPRSSAIGLLGLACFGVLAGCARASVSTREDDSRKQRIRQAAPAWLAEHGVPSLAVAYIEGGRLLFSVVVGERRDGEPASPRTLYNIASMTKPISAEVILRLASRGVFSLDDTMATHWVDPDVREHPWRDLLTPRIALSHQTGFPNWRYQTDGVLEFQHKPGEQFGYSGEGYEYVARYVEAKTGDPFETLAQTLVFTPRRMRETSYTERDWFAGRVAWPRGPDNSTREPTIRTNWVASDDLHTTVEDYAKFVIGVMQDESVNRTIASQRRTVQKATPEMAKCDTSPSPDCPQRMGTGLGWMVLEYEDHTVLWHGGGDWGERTLGFFIPERRTGAVVFTNGARGHLLIPRVIDELEINSPFTRFLRRLFGITRR